jgi:NitT/TauT family transport system ATP-binding protein
MTVPPQSAAAIGAAEPAPRRPSIVLRDVSKIYRRGAQMTHALDAVSLTIAAGELVAIVGPSGCGKSTLLRLICGLIPASGGEITIGDRRVSKPDGGVGIVFQAPILLDWRTVIGNLLFPVEMQGRPVAAYRAVAAKLLAQVGLADFADRYPYELSGGMRQRAAIARALVHDPVILIMDEPFGALDALTREQMRIDLEQLWLTSRKTVLFITHSIDEAVLLADRVVVMSPRPGRVERIIDVSSPRPRGLDGRKRAEFIAISQEITEIFLARGVLTRAGAGAGATA